MSQLTTNEVLIGTDALAEQLEDPRSCCIDCRFDLMSPVAGYADYLSGHIPGAVYAHLDEDLAGPVRPESGRHPLPDIAALEATFGELGVDGQSRITVYDAGNGAYAARAWWLLRWLGHPHVQLLDGGYAAWQGKGLRTVGGVERRPSRPFAAAIERDRVIGTQELARSVGNIGDRRLVDARDRARFRGEVEPIDTVAGHIPGALNLPFTDCLNADGTWRPVEELRSLFADVLGDDVSAAWSVMCGSGVTACHLAISGILAGYVEPDLYVGSWSEWIRDPGRAIATGSE